jgi:hypothetical protein
MTRRLAAAALAASLATAALLPVTFPATAAERVPLRMYATDRDVVVRSNPNGGIRLDLGLWIAAPDQAFRIDVTRDTYDDPIRARQIFADGTSRAIPPRLVRGFNGFRDFFRLQVKHGGEVVRARQFAWCPGGWEMQRINDSGPFEPRFPPGCYANPFTLGVIQGIDRGWAVPALIGERLRLDPGRYRFRVTIAPVYRDLFEIPFDDASVSVHVEVRDRGSNRVITGGEQPEPERAAVPIDTTPALTSLPDLVALPAFYIEAVGRRNKDVLTFAANIWNRGPAPLIVEGFRDTDARVMDAYQYFSLDGRVVGKAPVGGFEFDRRDGHDHWHFLQFARYRLLDARGHGVVRSHKQSFCLAPTDAIDMLVPRATWRPDSIGFSQCGHRDSIWIREVLPAGWGDTYFQWVGGQAFDISDLPNGRYYIEVRANPQGLLYDRTTANDVRLREVWLRGSPGDRRVVVPPWHGIAV